LHRISLNTGLVTIFWQTQKLDTSRNSPRIDFQDRRHRLVVNAVYPDFLVDGQDCGCAYCSAIFIYHVLL